MKRLREVRVGPVLVCRAYANVQQRSRRGGFVANEIYVDVSMMAGEVGRTQRGLWEWDGGLRGRKVGGVALHIPESRMFVS